MDAFTLMVAGALAGTIMAGGMALQYGGGARQASLLDWSLAGLLFACHGVLAAFALPAQAGSVLVPAIGNTCWVAAHAGILAGMRRQLGLATGWRPLALLAVLVMAAHGLPPVYGTAAGRLLFPLAVIAVLNLGTVWVAWRRARPESRVAWLPLVLLEVASVLQACASLRLLAGGVAPGVVQAANALSVLVFECVAMMGCALIAAHQQDLALRRAVQTDSMTGWLNRRALHDVAWREFRRCRRMREQAFFITFDIDHFKAVNERYGHSVGDAAIRHVAAVAAQVARCADDRFRIGDKEFAVLLTGATPLEACRIAERLRELVAHSPLDVDGEGVRLTISVGVAALEAGDIQWEDILRRADQALGYAKQQGHNRVSALGIDCGGQGGMLPLWGASAC
jgi:diguanylate cyclase (GGDEF)-like protein